MFIAYFLVSVGYHCYWQSVVLCRLEISSDDRLVVVVVAVFHSQILSSTGTETCCSRLILGSLTVLTFLCVSLSCMCMHVVLL